MKRLANSFGIAFSMYSRIPMVRCDWTEENMKYVMCFFPWIGAVIGALCFGWYHLASWLSVDAVLAVIVLMMIPGESIWTGCWTRQMHSVPGDRWSGGLRS